MTQKEKFMHLIAILRDIPEESIDMSDWVSRVGHGDMRHECGTVCCAIGWAGNDPIFNSLGFGLVAGGSFSFEVYPEYKTESSLHNGWVAVREFFGITQSTALDLFSSGSYKIYCKTESVKDQLIRNLITFTESLEG